MALLETPCGEKINVSRWPYHLTRCTTCLVWYAGRKIEA